MYLKILRSGCFVILFVIFISFGKLSTEFACLVDDPEVVQFGIDTLCEMSKDATVSFIVDNFFWVSVSHSMIIGVATVYYAVKISWSSTPEGKDFFENASKRKQADMNAANLNDLRKYVITRIKTFSLPTAIFIPIINETAYGGSDGSFGLSDVFNGALFFLLLTPLFYTFIWVAVQFVSSMFTFFAPNGSFSHVICKSGALDDKYQQEKQSLIIRFMVYNLLNSIFGFVLYAGDRPAYNWLDLHLGGLGPYVMIFITYCRIFGWFFTAMSKVVAANERQNDHHSNDEKLRSSKSTQVSKNKKKKKKRNEKDEGLSTKSLLNDVKHISYLLLCRIPFLYNWAMFTILYSVAAVNVMFHLLVSASIKEDAFVTVIKLLLLLLTGWNMLAPLSILLQLSIDSWSDLDYLTINFMESYTRLSSFLYDGTFLRDVPDNLVRLQGYEIFDGLDTDGDGTLSPSELKEWRRLWDEKKNNGGLTRENANSFLRKKSQEILGFDSTTNETTPITRKQFAVAWQEIFSKDDDMASTILQSLPKARVHSAIRKGMKGVGGMLAFICVALVIYAKLVAHEDIARDAGKRAYVNSTDIVFDSDGGRNSIFTSVHQDWSKRYESIQPPLPQYAVCPLRWHGLSSVDYSILSALSYLDWTKKKQLQMIKDVLKGAFPSQIYGDVSVIEDFHTDVPERVPKNEGDPVEIFTNFITFRFPKFKVDVIAVQGTNPANPMEVIADLRMWFESSSLTAASLFLPTVNMMSLELTSRLVYALNLCQKFFEVENVELDFHEVVVKYTVLSQNNLKKEHANNEWNLAITGHSLGGGISTIVGSTVGIDSIAFSPPGMTASRYKFQTTINRITSRPNLNHSTGHSVNFLPLRDIVPKTDGHFGLVQNTLCPDKNPMACHSIERMVCDLVRRCGDGFNGQRFSGCNFREENLEEHRYDMFPYLKKNHLLTKDDGDSDDL